MNRRSRPPAAQSVSLSVLTHRQAVVLLLGCLAVVQGDLAAQSPPALAGPGYLQVYQVAPTGPADTDLHFRTRCIGTLPSNAAQGSLELPVPPGTASRSVPLSPPCDHPFTWRLSDANRLDPQASIRLHDGEDQVTELGIPYFLNARDAVLPDNAPPPAYVQALAAGSTWMALGTRDGLYVLDTISGAASRIDLDRAPDASADPNRPVVTALDARQDRLWAATSRGICVVDRSDGSGRCEPPAPPEVMGEAAVGVVSQVLLDPLNSRCALGIGPHRELRRYEDVAGAPTLSSTEVNSAWRESFAHLLWLKNGSVWQLWAAGNRGTRILNRVEKAGAPCGALVEAATPGAISSLPATRQTLAQGRVWAADGDALRCWSVSSAGISACPGFDRARSLGLGTLHALSADPGGLWLGAEQGLFRLPVSGMGTPRRIPVEGIPGASTAPVLAMSPGPQDALWVGSGAGLLRCAADGHCTRLAGREEGLDGAWITAVYRGADHRFWIGDTRGAIHALNQSPHDWKPQLDTVFRLQGSSVDVQDGRRRILSLLEHNDRLWVGLEHGLRRGRLLPGGKLALERMTFELPNGVVADSRDFNPEVRALKADDLGRIWVGTSQGLFVWRSSDRAGTDAPTGLSPSRALTKKSAGRALSAGTDIVRWKLLSGEAHDIRDLLIDRRGWLWVASNEGLFVYSGSELDDRARLPELPQSLKSPVNRLYESADGHVWIGLEEGGLYRWPARTSSLLSSAFSDDPLRFEALELPPIAAPGITGTPSGLLSRGPLGLFTGVPRVSATGTSPAPIRGEVLAIGEDRLNGVWVLTGGRGSSERRAWCLTSGGIWLPPFGAASGLSQPGGALLALDWHGALWTGGSLTWLTPERSCTKARADMAAGGHGLLLVALLMGWISYWGHDQRRLAVPGGSSSSPSQSSLRRLSPYLALMGAFIGVSGTVVAAIRIATMDVFKSWYEAGGDSWLLVGSCVAVAAYGLKVHLDEAPGWSRWVGFLLAVGTLGAWMSVQLAAHRQHPVALCQCVPDSVIPTNLLIVLAGAAFLMAFVVVARSFISPTPPTPTGSTATRTPPANPPAT